MLKPSFSLILILSSAVVLFADQGIRVTVTNPADADLENATIAVPWKAVVSAMPGLKDRHYQVVDAATREPLIFQQSSLGDGAVLFQYDLGAGETRHFLIETAAQAMPAPRTNRLHARKVPERIDDFAWENDRMAYRVYGPKAQHMVEQGIKGGIMSSGVDVWAKRVPYPILEKWYQGKDYHKDHGEGADFFAVGPTLGAGGLGFLVDGELVMWSNWTAARILERGPVRLVFELDYPAVKLGERTLSGTKRLTIDRGESLYRSEVTFYEAGQPTSRPVDYVVGLVTRKDVMDRENAAKGWAALWGPTGEGGDGELGTAAVVHAAQFQGFARDAKHLLVKGTAPAGEPAQFIVGAVWSERGYFPDMAAWAVHLDSIAKNLGNPLEIKVSAEEIEPSRHTLPAASSTLPSREKTLAVIQRVIDWQIREPYRWSDQGWIRPIHMLGVLSVAEATDSASLLEQVRAYCEKEGWKRDRILPTANELLMAIVYCRTNRALPEGERADLAPMVEQYEAFLTGNGDLNFSAHAVASRTKRPHYFVDSLFTGAPGLAALIRETGREDFREYFNEQFWNVANTLRDPETGLFFRDKTLPHDPDGSKRLWACGSKAWNHPAAPTPG